MRHWEDLLTRPAPEVELVLWVGAASEVGLGPNNVFPVGEGAGAAPEAGLGPNKFPVGGGAGAAPKPVWGQISFQLEEERVQHLKPVWGQITYFQLEVEEEERVQ
jgi:hypothetical protein